MNVVLGFGMDWSVLLKAWLLALKNFIDSVKVVGNKLGILEESVASTGILFFLTFVGGLRVNSDLHFSYVRR